MRKIAAILCLALGTLTGVAQTASQPAFTAKSRMPGAAMHSSLSGQFSIRDLESKFGNPIPLGSDISVHYARVDATLLTVSCERIKHAFLAEMDAQDNWRDEIFIELRRARTLNDTIYIASERFGNGWNYHVSLPDTVETARLVTSIVDVLLLEMANRNASHSAEIPAWLGYGLSQDILRSTHIEMVLEPVKPNAQGLKIGMVTMVGTNTNSLAIAHADLSAAPALTLEQLSWPDESRLDGPEAETFRSSAQLFVHDLLQLRDGRPAMRAFIKELPQHLNWQLSFLEAFKADFGSQLDVEKWWALCLVDFTGREISQTWTPQESWEKLNAIVRPIVDVRTKANELPMRTEVSLQTIIDKWDMPRQVSFLKERSEKLFSLRSRVSQETAKLVDDYRQAIDVYLKKRARENYVHSPRMQAVFGPDFTMQQTIEELNVLDSIREDLRPKTPMVQSTEPIKSASN